MRRVIATSVAALIALVGIALSFERGGLLAWVGLIVGLVLLGKTLVRPSKLDFWLTISAASLWAFAWAGTTYYVISTWESGEVVELGIDMPSGTHTARVWILDTDESPLIIYDAPREVADFLLSGVPVRLKRHGEESLKRPVVMLSDELPEEEVNRVYELLAEKYGDRNAATDVFYGVLGRSRNRVLLLLRMDSAR